ncbi:MAG TPA: hypothetical protein VF903_11020, partial [Nitrospirota bacterium]
MMKNVKRKEKNVHWLVIVIMLTMPYAPARAGETSASTAKGLRAEVQALEQEAARLEEENSGLRRMIKDLEDDELYLVVDTEGNRLTMRKGNEVLHTAVCGTGSRQS